MRKRSIRTERRSWFNLFLRHRGWIALIAVGLVLLFTGISMYLYYTDGGFIDQAVPVDAEVIGTRHDGPFGSNLAFATLRYQVDGQVYEPEVKADFFAVYLETLGDRMTVYYMRDDPAQVYTQAVEGATKRGKPYQILAAFWGIVAIGAGIWSGRPATQAMRARRYGSYEAARVSHVEVVYRIKWTGTWLDMWEETPNGRLVFVDHQGQLAKSLPYGRDFYLSQWKHGDEINVYRGINSSWWEGDVGPREEVTRAFPKVT